MASPLFGGTVSQRLRLASGLLLFAFALAHFLNHALGIFGVEAMEAAQAWRLGVTRWPPVTILLAAALLVHVALGLSRVARRSSWRMPPWEAAQIALGLAIPVWLFGHIAAQYGSYAIVGQSTRYSDALPVLAGVAGQQSALLLVVWAHGCIGLHYWLRLSPLYRRLKAVLLAFAVLVPALGLAGFVAALRDQADAPPPIEATPAPGGEARTALHRSVYEYSVWAGWGILFGTVGWIGVGAVRGRWQRRIRITYADGPTVSAPLGPTLLEISRMFGVPHAAVCGGRARCSTCRVQVLASARTLPPPEGAEAGTLRRVRAGPDVRLACQLRPRGEITVLRLVRLKTERGVATPGHFDDVGVERTLAVLFLDIRGFTALSEARLPYDTVFLLNRFFAETGAAITGAGGRIDKYLGDGLMALFGLETTPEAGCRAALAAAVAIDAALDRLNRELGAELAEPLRIGIGLHVGPLVLGRIGHSGSAATTVIGPAVNVASRLEALTKELGVQVVVSRLLAALAGLPGDAFPATEVTVRGASEALEVFLVHRGRDLDPLLAAEHQNAA